MRHLLVRRFHDVGMGGKLGVLVAVFHPLNGLLILTFVFLALACTTMRIGGSGFLGDVIGWSFTVLVLVSTICSLVVAFIPGKGVNCYGEKADEPM